ncbi:hypothetical protein BASA50_000060 [Batrachochytrium salamandrivorans]|uniref:RGS domain-containing protein n=1 Tax=Batrachochytrium salamandrivorans TaxID=1357716 RepID=A0ABQ8EUY5_9FUNG|nr:hypothetical protein BASA62_007017 [Batrachochytrium salamandrivorans]KAH6587013.1 hypothetical protein BASA50_000060 [Batrachochytrium salamandrivorans]KAH6601263.1 hypothetical protein BASA61_002033 [Batrachochytrium salamandrivorans]
MSVGNLTSNAELARHLTRTGNYGIFKLSLAIIQTLLILICTPLFIHERRHPMVKYRSWTINLLACAAATASLLMDACLSMDHWVSYHMLPVFSYIRIIGVVMASCVFVPTYVRHYYLLQLPILQTQLLDYETMMDLDKYKALSRSLVRIKFLSSEKFAFSFFSINFILCLIVTLYGLAATDFDLLALGHSTPGDSYSINISIAQVGVSLVFLLSYGPWAPKDNFQIMNQFYIITLLTMLNCFAAVIGLVSGSISINEISITISSFCGFLAIVIDLAIPLQFMVNGSRYRTRVAKLDGIKLNNNKVAVSSPSYRMRTSPTNQYHEGETMIELTSAGSSSLESTLDEGRTSQVGQYTISGILADKVLRTAFRKFLAREFAMESLLFIEAVRRYKERIQALPTKSTIEAMTDMIMTEYILPSSVNEVNLPKSTVTKLNIQIAASLTGVLDLEATVAIFDEAVLHIEQMLVLNHLRRFQVSSLFRDATH